MRIGTPKFNGERLTQAREFRMLSKVALAELVGEKYSVNIGKWEKSGNSAGSTSPSPKAFDRLCNVLDFPPSFFLDDFAQSEPQLHFERAQSQVTKIMRMRARNQMIWQKEILAYLETEFEIPEFHAPTIKTKDFRLLAEETIDKIAMALRQIWNIGFGPIADLTGLLESKGFVISRIDLQGEKLDGFCDFKGPRAFVVLDKKKPACRSRLSLAHELGHLILHRGVTETDLATSSKFKLIEEQANQFASSFLMPEEAFTKDIWAPTLNCFRDNKEKWGVSIAGQLMRSHQLGIIDDRGFKGQNINISRKGWRKSEPLDDVLKPEEPQLLKQCFDLLLESKPPREIISDLNLPARIIEDVANLPQDYLAEVEPDLKIVPLDPSKSRSTPTLTTEQKIIDIDSF